MGPIGKASEDMALDVLGVIDMRLARLSPAERSVAEVIMADPGAATEFTIGQLAAAAGTSEATVTRLCRSLDLPGYAQLRLQLAVQVDRRQASSDNDAVITLPGDLEPGESLVDVVKKVGFANARSVEHTVAKLDLEVLSAVIDSVLAAPRLLTFGVGSGAPVAVDAAAKLAIAGCPAHSTSDIHAALMTTAVMDPDDVLLVFSHSGRPREAVEVLATATENGACTVLVTGDATSPAAKRARHVLQTAAREMTFRSGGVASRIAQLTVVDCLYMAILHRRFDQSLEAMERMHDAVSGHIVGSDRVRDGR